MMSKDRLIPLKKAAALLGVHPNTLRNWDDTGQLKAVRTHGGHRRFRESDILLILGREGPSQDQDEGFIKVAVYCRVSSHDQKTKGDLDRQVGRVSAFCSDKGFHVVETLTDVGSGMSDTRPKLRNLFKLVNEGKISKVVVEHKDRLCRFGFGVMEAYFASHGVEVIWTDEVLGKSYEEELVEDILSLMASFSARIYGKRSAENRKKKAQNSSK